MAGSHKDSYSGNCNPSRRAKRFRSSPRPSTDSEPEPDSDYHPTQFTPPSSTTVRGVHAVPILPRRPHTSGKSKAALSPSEMDSVHDDHTPTTAVVTTPGKRGRKPGVLSRTAREAQRKLNHSIIEKARRTKINEALSTLRQLVPANYGNPRSQDQEEEDGEYEGNSGKGANKAKGKGKGAGKKEEKEKEFKLEILIRTVSFMQDLLERVAVLEDGKDRECANCGGREQPSGLKRKRTEDESYGEDEGGSRGRHNSDLDDTRPDGGMQRGGEGLAITGNARPHLFTRPSPDGPFTSHPPRSRLPSISSWLPDSYIDPSLLPPTKHSTSRPNTISHLPSPPSSTHFHPVTTAKTPPTLNLGPVAGAYAGLSPIRTPEDESAASLLLQISASSPPFLPTSASSCTPFDLTKGKGSRSVSDFTPLDSGGSRAMQAQTPSSILGLTR